MGRTRAATQLALVGPGSELQLTLDGRAVPHEVVVAEREGVPSVLGATVPRPEAAPRREP